MLAPGGWGASPKGVLKAPYSSSSAVASNSTTILGCAGAKNLAGAGWNASTGVGGFSEKARAWVCPRLQGIGGASSGVASSSLVISLPLSISTSGKHAVVAHWSLAMTLPVFLSNGTCVVNATAKSAACAEYAEVEGDLWGAIFDQTTATYLASAHLAYFDNYTLGSNSHSSGKWYNQSYSYCICSPQGRIAFHANGSFNASHTYVLTGYLEADATAWISTSHATFFGTVVAAANIATRGNQLVLLWVSVT